MGGTVEIVKVSDPAELLLLQEGFAGAYPTYLMLDFDTAVLTAAYHDGVALPSYVRRGMGLWVPIPCLTADAANVLLAQVAPIAQRILDGHTGEGGRGRLDTAASVAAQELRDHVHGVAWRPEDLVHIRRADSWLTKEDLTVWVSRTGLSADSTKDELKAIGELLIRDFEQVAAAEPGVSVLVGVAGVLQDFRDDLRVAEADELSRCALQIQRLNQVRDQALRRLAAWGWSDRFIADLSDLSHPTVGARVRRDAAKAVLARLAAGGAWHDHGTHLVYDDSEPDKMVLERGGGEVALAVGNDRVGTGVMVHRPKVVPAPLEDRQDVPQDVR